MAYGTQTTPPRTLGAIRLIILSMTAAFLLVSVGVAVEVDLIGTLKQLSDPESLSVHISRVGPLAVVVLLALAVVVSPIPSGPVAMAAGAMFGILEGGALTAAGAVLGAFIAFSLSRSLGYRPLSTSNLALANWITRPRPEYKLALIVLVSRLIPFISFDAVSYVAGLTTLRASSFAIATTVGVLPASFAFAALGAGMATMDNALVMIVACGITAVLPLGWGVSKALKARKA